MQSNMDSNNYGIYQSPEVNRQVYFSHTQSDNKQRRPVPQQKLYIWGSLFDQGNDFTDDSLYDSANSRYQQKSLAETSGDFLSKSQYDPQIVSINKEAVTIACGKNHAAIVTQKGELFMIGANDGGQIGIGEFQCNRRYNEPVPLQSLLYENIHITQVSCGHSHTLAITSLGKVLSWGYGKFGALGHGDFESLNSHTEIAYFSTKFSSSQHIQQIECGAHHSALLDSGGNLYMWGAGEVGQLGLSERINESKPRQINTRDIDVKMVACGYFHTLLLTSQGRVLQTGQIKDEDNDYSIVSQYSEIQAISNIHVQSIKAKEYSAALSSDGYLIVWKSPNHPQFVKLSAKIRTYELCKQFVLLRTHSQTFKWSIETQQLEDVHLVPSEGNPSDSLLACGPTYIVGILKDCPEAAQTTPVYNISSAYISRTSKKEHSSRASSANPLRIKNIKAYESNYQSRTQSREKVAQFPARHSFNPEMMKSNQKMVSDNSMSQEYFNFNITHDKLNQSNTDSYFFEKKQLENNESPYMLRGAQYQVSKLNGQSIRFSYEDKSQQSQQYKESDSFLQRSPEIIDARQQSISKSSQLSAYKSGSKRKDLQELLNKERERRMEAEDKIQQVYDEFESFKKEVSIDQMRQVLSESKTEYQKLYDICLIECEKSAQLNELLKTEKQYAEQKELQISSLTEEVRSLKTKLLSQEEDFLKSKLQLHEQLKSLEHTVKEQQQIIDSQREEFRIEKSDLIEKKFDVEEICNLQKEEIENLNLQIQELLTRIEEERRLKDSFDQQRQELQDLVHQKIKELVSQQETMLNQDRMRIELDHLKTENVSLQQKIQSKNNSLKECDQLIAQLRASENELKQQIQKQQETQYAKSGPSVTQGNYRSTTPRATTVKKDINLQRTQVNGKTQQAPSRNQAIQQSLSSSSAYNTRKQTTPSAQQQKQMPLKKENTKQRGEHSPEKLSNMIKLQDQNTQNFIKEINKIVGNSPILPTPQNKQQRISRSSSPLNGGFSQPQSSKHSNRFQQPMPSSKHNFQKQSPISSTKIKFASTNFIDEQTPTPQESQLQTLNNDGDQLTDIQIDHSSSNQQNIIHVKYFEAGSDEEESVNNEITTYHELQQQQEPEESCKMTDSNKKKQVTFHLKTDKETQINQAFQDTLLANNTLKQTTDLQQDSEISKLYESLSEEMKSLKGTNVDELKGKLDVIRKNKQLLEEKIKQYEKKLNN